MRGLALFLLALGAVLGIVGLGGAIAAVQQLPRGGNADLLAALAPLAHQATWLAVAAERAVSRAMGGSCSMPLAAHAEFSGEYLQLRAAWGDPDGAATLVRAQSAAAVADLDQAAALWAKPGFFQHAAAQADLNVLAYALCAAGRAVDAHHVFQTLQGVVTPWPWNTDGPALQRFEQHQAKAERGRQGGVGGG